MSALPIFVFASFASASDQRFLGWTSFRDSIDAAYQSEQLQGEARLPLRNQRSGPVPLPSIGIWRLLAPNNRELCRSSAAYPSFRVARDHVQELQRRIAGLEIVPVRGTSSSQYGWLATLDRDIVITAGRWFGAPSTAVHSAVTTLELFATATVSQEIRPNARTKQRHRQLREPESATAPW